MSREGCGAQHTRALGVDLEAFMWHSRKACGFGCCRAVPSFGGQMVYHLFALAMMERLSDPVVWHLAPLSIDYPVFP